MLAFDITKLQRLGKVYDLDIEIKVLKDGENSGSDSADWADVGIVKYTKPSINESKDECKNTSGNGPSDSLHVFKAAHSTLTLYSCYHNGCNFSTENELDYQSHGALKHPKNPLLYPSKTEIQHYGLKPQGKE
jgi:hypothetical protein